MKHLFVSLLFSLMMLGGISSSFAANAQCSAPNVLILFDMSGSLGNKATANSNYNQAVSAVEQVVYGNDDKIRYGLKTFPTPNNSTTTKVYCTVDDYLAVDIGLGNYDAIHDFFDSCSGPRSDYDTPMYQALSKTKNMKSLHDSDHRNYIILITDGIQDCCHGGDYDDDKDCNSGYSFSSPNYYNQTELAENRQDLIDLVGELKEAGIYTYVVAFGNKVDVLGLDGMAIAGGTARANCIGGGNGDCYYSSSNQSELLIALEDITELATQEVCDGLDNDCNGIIDDGLDIICTGTCGFKSVTGVQKCVNGAYTGCIIEKSEEICDGIDNDCDGLVDEGLTKLCTGLCGKNTVVGTQSCQNGSWTDCKISVSEEICDGVDNDCNGEIDDGLSRACALPCGIGVETCTNGVWGKCVVETTEEICGDGKDNDCDGQIDESCPCHPGEVQGCGLDRGRCKPGIQTCLSNGQWGQCEGAIDPIPEVCDGHEDEDCDGYTDEDCKCIDGTTSPCGENIGICKLGVQTCINGTWGDCEGAVWPEEDDPCDGLDNDCDGQVDEFCQCVDGDVIDCGTNEGLCEMGQQTCENGYWSVCRNGVDRKDEICDNLDNDCDGRVDNNAMCPNNTQCRCGICVSPCASDGTCHSGKCINGYCVMESCPEGFVCDGDICVPGEKEKFPEVPALPEKGCSCNDTGSPLNALWLLLALLGLTIGARCKHY